MKINVEEYSPDWSNKFELLSEILSSILAPLSPVIEHIGSTSVPGLAAKPIIDIAVGLKSVEDLDKTIAPMIENRFIYYKVFNKSMPERRLYVGLKDPADSIRFKSIYTDSDIIPHEEIGMFRLTHIHIWVYRSPEYTRHIAFRGFLRSHPQICQQYGDLKKQLSLKDWKDGMEYNAGKDTFIKEVEKKALKWFHNKSE